MPSILRRDTGKPRASLAFQKRSSRRSSTRRKSSVSDHRSSSVDQRTSSRTSAANASDKEANKEGQTIRDYRVSKAAREISEVLIFMDHNDPAGFSNYSFSGTDLRSAKVSALSVRERRPLHRLSKVHPILKKKKGKKENLLEITSADERGSNDSFHDNRVLRRSIIRNDSISPIQYEFEDDSSEDYGPASDESRDAREEAEIEENDDFDVDFFQNLGEIPSIDKISLDSSIKEIAKPVKSVSKNMIAGKDMGRFVNPLTGVVLSSSSSETLLKPSPPPASRKSSRYSVKKPGQEEEFIYIDEEGEEEESPFIPREQREDDDLLALIELDSEEDEAPRAEAESSPEDAAMDIYWHQQKHVAIEEALATAEENVDSEELRALRENIAEFVDHMIHKVVTKVEAMRPSKLLRKTLDKKALMEDLQDKLSDLEIEQKARQFLNRKIVEYYRRKNSLRHIVEDNPDYVVEAMETYRQALTNLDVEMTKEIELQESVDLKMDEVREKVKEAEEIERKSNEDFETLIRTTMTKENYKSLQRIVENLLQNMATMRNEISETRYKLIEKQHTLAKLQQQDEKMENIGDGWTIRIYDNLQAEITLLDKRKEEKNIELNKLRAATTSSVHIMTHLREKQKMAQNLIAVRQSCLDDLLEEKKQCRRNINMAQLRRKKLRTEIGNVHFQGGLHGKPALMADYDKTMEQVNVMRKKVDILKNKSTFLQSRVDLLESKMTLLDDNNENDKDKDKDGDDDEDEDDQRDPNAYTFEGSAIKLRKL